MEFIKKNLGANKVTVFISSNDYEEIYPYVEEDNMFNDIENMFDMFRKLKTKTNNHVNLSTKQTNTYHKDKNGNQQLQNTIFTGLDGIVHCILQTIEPTYVLLPYQTQYMKIEQFKKKLIMTLDMVKDNDIVVKKTEAKLFIEENKYEFIMHYICHVINKSIAIVGDVNQTVFGTHNSCLVIEPDSSGSFIVVDDNAISSDIRKFILNDKIKHYITEGIPQKLNALLVKELKNIATDLNIPLTHVVDNKRKSLLKNELKDLIAIKFEEYKQ